jgi:hypothetical protein
MNVFDQDLIWSAEQGVFLIDTKQLFCFLCSASFIMEQISEYINANLNDWSYKKSNILVTVNAYHCFNLGFIYLGAHMKSEVMMKGENYEIVKFYKKARTN